MKVILENSTEKFDFVFFCESKVRELDGCCIIAHELEKRGYKIGIMNWWLPLVDEKYKPVNTQVVMAHAVYKDNSLNHELSYVSGGAKVIHMQWEQIYSKKDLTNTKAPWKIEGEAKEVIHLSWGMDNYNKLVGFDKVPKENVKIVGQVSMDLFRKEFEGYFISKEDLYSQFDIPLDKKVCLFISSFSFVNLPDNIQDPELVDLSRISNLSQIEILNWISKELDAREDIVFIYRPHPAEADNPVLKDISSRNDRFKVIGEYSVKQWILCTDVIYNWYSTSMAEIYFAGKSCYILRPITIPDLFECQIFENGKFITSYDEFNSTFENEECGLPIPIENIENAYFYREDEAIYKRISDVCEDVIKGNYKKFSSKKSVITNDDFIHKVKKSLVGKIALIIKHKIEQILPVSDRRRRDIEYDKYIHEMYEKNNFNQCDVDEIMAKLEMLLG